MTLLDCGCGRSTSILNLAEAIAPGQVIGIDINPRVIEQARERAAKSGLSNVSFEVADICELPFPDDHFDAAHANFVFCI